MHCSHSYFKVNTTFNCIFQFYFVFRLRKLLLCFKLIKEKPLTRNKLVKSTSVISLYIMLFESSFSSKSWNGLSFDKSFCETWFSFSMLSQNAGVFKINIGEYSMWKNHQFVSIVVGRYTSISRVCFYDFQLQSTVKKMEKLVSKYREQKNSSLFKQLKQFYTKRKTPKKSKNFYWNVKKRLYL